MMEVTEVFQLFLRYMFHECKMSVKYRVYEVVCKDRRIPDRYIGYTSMTKQVFIECSQGIVRDKMTGKKVDLGSTKQKPSTLQMFIDEHGGWSNWNFRVFKYLWDTRAEANLVKEVIMSKYPDKYTINIYKTDKKRAPPPKKTFDFDSDDESVDTDA